MRPGLPVPSWVGDRLPPCWALSAGATLEAGLSVPERRVTCTRVAPGQAAVWVRHAGVLGVALAHGVPCPPLSCLGVSGKRAQDGGTSRPTVCRGW